MVQDLLWKDYSYSTGQEI